MGMLTANRERKYHANPQFVTWIQSQSACWRCSGPPLVLESLWDYLWWQNSQDVSILEGRLKYTWRHQIIINAQMWCIRRSTELVVAKYNHLEPQMFHSFWLGSHIITQARLVEQFKLYFQHMNEKHFVWFGDNGKDESKIELIGSSDNNLALSRQHCWL